MKLSPFLIYFSANMSKQSLVLVLSVLILLYNEQVQSENEVLKKVCITETSVNPALVEKAFDGEFSDRKELKCFFKCYYQESGVINDLGEIHVDAIKSKISPKANKKLALQAIDKCKSLKGQDICETAFKLHKCLYDNEIVF